MNRPAVDCDVLSRIVADHLRFGGEHDAKTPAIACGYLAATRSIAGRILDELVATDPTFDRRTFERATGIDFGLDDVDEDERRHFAEAREVDEDERAFLASLPANDARG